MPLSFSKCSWVYKSPRQHVRDRTFLPMKLLVCDTVSYIFTKVASADISEISSQSCQLFLVTRK